MPPQPPYLVDFAAQLTDSLRNANLKSVVVANFVTPEGADLPQGRFLATQLSLEMQRHPGTLVVADPEQLKDALAAQKLESKDLSVSAFLKPVGKSLAVEAALTGTLDTSADRYILKVSIRRVADGSLAATGIQSFQRSPLLEGLGALDSTNRAPSVARAGIDAVSTPVCEYCPSPHFKEKPTP